MKKTTDIFIKESLNIHNHKYNYDLVNYTNAHNKVKIICEVHGIFEQRARDHLNGRGCNECAIQKRKEKFSSN